ncbi:hypothetical protein P350_34500 [Burkholderia cepacia JBK9]|nr:hypothetical protein P350_34500 [Burkholderia cepacia JBK9]
MRNPIHGDIERTSVESGITGGMQLAFADAVLHSAALTAIKEAAMLVATSKGLEYINDTGGATFAEIDALQTHYADLCRLYLFVPGPAMERAAAVVKAVFRTRHEVRSSYVDV